MSGAFRCHHRYTDILEKLIFMLTKLCDTLYNVNKFGDPLN